MNINHLTPYKAASVTLAIRSARMVLHLVAAGEDRPRLAIIAAERWLTEPTEENRLAACAAACTTYTACAANCASGDAAYTDCAAADASADAACTACAAATTVATYAACAAAAADAADAATYAIYASTSAAWAKES